MQIFQAEWLSVSLWVQASEPEEYMCVCVLWLLRECIQYNWMSYLVIESTHVQGSVSRSVLSAHVCSIEQQVFKMLHMSVTASLTKHTHIKSLHWSCCFRFVSICSLHRTKIMLMSKTIAAASLFHAHTPRSHILMFSVYEMRKSRTVCLCLVLSMSLFFPP